MGRVSGARERLLASALELIGGRSYASVGVQQLCEHAGVKKGSFYHFFPSKEALTVALLDRQWQRFRERARADAFSPRRRPLARVERFIALYCVEQAAARGICGRMPGCPFGNLAVELSTLSEPVREKLESIFAEQAAMLESALDDAVVAGDIAPIDVPDAARAVLAYVQGLLLFAKLHDRPALLQDLSGHALGLLTVCPGARKSLPMAVHTSPSPAKEN
jgi:TetR/AcrR family transcriptional repressor of nem operon